MGENRQTIAEKFVKGDYGTRGERKAGNVHFEEEGYRDVWKGEAKRLPTFYSYATPIAYRLDEHTIAVDPNTYSVSTSSHQHALRMALHWAGWKNTNRTWKPCTGRGMNTSNHFSRRGYGMWPYDLYTDGTPLDVKPLAKKTIREYKNLIKRGKDIIENESTSYHTILDIRRAIEVIESAMTSDLNSFVDPKYVSMISLFSGDKPAEKVYKVTDNRGFAMHGGFYKYPLPTIVDGEYVPGEWTEPISNPVICASGYHVTMDPPVWGGDREQNTITWEVEVDGFGGMQHDKLVFERIRLLRPSFKYTGNMGHVNRMIMDRAKDGNESAFDNLLREPS